VCLASCGSSGSTQEFGADFVEQADAACERVDAAALGTLTQGSDLAASLREGQRRGDGLASELARLDAPREHRPDRAAYVVIVSRLAALSGEAADAVAGGDQARLGEIEATQGPLVRRARELARRMGLRSCTPSA
jgi:hypothetical protein